MKHKKPKRAKAKKVKPKPLSGKKLTDEQWDKALIQFGRCYYS